MFIDVRVKLASHVGMSNIFGWQVLALITAMVWNVY